MPALDLTTLHKAVAQLDTCLACCASGEAQRDVKLAEVFRSAAIQAFESIYELSHKVLRRYIVATTPTTRTMPWRCSQPSPPSRRR